MRTILFEKEKKVFFENGGRVKKEKIILLDTPVNDREVDDFLIDFSNIHTVIAGLKYGKGRIQERG